MQDPRGIAPGFGLPPPSIHDAAFARHRLLSRAAAAAAAARHSFHTSLPLEPGSRHGSIYVRTGCTYALWRQLAQSRFRGRAATSLADRHGSRTNAAVQRSATPRFGPVSAPVLCRTTFCGVAPSSQPRARCGVGHAPNEAPRGVTLQWHKLGPLPPGLGFAPAPPHRAPLPGTIYQGGGRTARPSAPPPGPPSAS